MNNITTKNLKKYIKNFLFRNNFIDIDDNFIDAEKAFMASSIIKYAFLRRKENKINDKQFELFLSALIDFKLDKIRLKWENGQVCFSRNKS